jgi:hypothetical protein
VQRTSAILLGWVGDNRPYRFGGVAEDGAALGPLGVGFAAEERKLFSRARRRPLATAWRILSSLRFAGTKWMSFSVPFGSSIMVSLPFVGYARLFVRNTASCPASSRSFLFS